MALFHRWSLFLLYYELSRFLAIDAVSSPASGLWYDLPGNNVAIDEKEIVEMRNRAKKMFQFGYDNYMKHAYPEDELDPIHCTGRGHDFDDEYVVIRILMKSGTDFPCSYTLQKQDEYRTSLNVIYYWINPTQKSYLMHYL